MQERIKIIDAFKLNNAPFIIETFSGYERKRYTAEAYTEDFMIRSSKTNHLCRYVVSVDNETVSAYQYFGIKPVSSQRVNFIKMLERMTREQRTDLYLSLTDLRFNDIDDSSEFIATYNCSTFYTTDLELYCICTSGFLQEIIWDLIKK